MNRIGHSRVLSTYENAFVLVLNLLNLLLDKCDAAHSKTTSDRSVGYTDSCYKNLS